ncbi:flavin reductase family protein [Halalkalibacter alkalisediminis]|uniref:Flavin reductase family protein n=1 Tax=Halalkalibacter alkalisediminis TaxID=935616 RepID=A0ABV6NHE8_9BACI|nr:flavin reductase family protein [Halalkalibacter alkalisediminis]
MKAVDPSDLVEQENYKFLTGSIIPRPVAFVTTLSKDRVLNAAPFSYFNIVSANPPMISVSVQRSNGVMKDTSRNAIEHKEFVVHVADEFYLNQLNVTAKSLPSNVSEVEDAKLTPVESLKIKVPGIQEAKVRMECILEKAISLGGTEQEPACELLIGRVVQYHIQEELYQNGRIDAENLRPISRLAGNFYAKLGEMIELERPK